MKMNDFYLQKTFVKIDLIITYQYVVKVLIVTQEVAKTILRHKSFYFRFLQQTFPRRDQDQENIYNVMTNIYSYIFLCIRVTTYIILSENPSKVVKYIIIALERNISMPLDCKWCLVLISSMIIAIIMMPCDWPV